MDEVIKANIINLLKEKAQIADVPTETPYNYASLKDTILQIEVKQERDALLSMLEDLDIFEAQFKARCILRLLHTDHSIPFTDMPESITNQIYWEIALLVFKPKTMAEMLTILVPNCQTLVSVSLANGVLVVGKSGFEEDRKQVEPVLESVSIFEALAGPPNRDILNHYVFADDLMLNAADIANFSLGLHITLQRCLEERYPKLAKKLYAHNYPLQNLASDILILNNNGITPRAAIEQLIRGLMLGGNSMTGGSRYATTSSELALRQFFDYFNAIPLEMRENLRALRGGNRTLGEIIDKDIEVGECVESIASRLKLILQNNKHHNDWLDSPPKFAPKDLKELESKYKTSSEEDYPS